MTSEVKSRSVGKVHFGMTDPLQTDDHAKVARFVASGGGGGGGGGGTARLGDSKDPSDTRQPTALRFLQLICLNRFRLPTVG